MVGFPLDMVLEGYVGLFSGVLDLGSLKLDVSWRLETVSSDADEVLILSSWSAGFALDTFFLAYSSYPCPCQSSLFRNKLQNTSYHSDTAREVAYTHYMV